LEIGLSQQTGSVVYLSYPATGVILDATRGPASILDVAYPVTGFLPLRLASRFSSAHITRQEGAVTITWDRLGPSRSNVALPPGKVSAQVTIRAAGDGRSVILTCRIENHSTAPVTQILFPDFFGLKPFDGVEQTRLRLARGVTYPFMVPIRKPNAVGGAYYSEVGWREYSPLGYYSENALRWLDYGSWRGGLSVFEKKWGTEDWPDVFTYRAERDPMSLRLAWAHAGKRRIGVSGDPMPMQQPVLAAGATWESAEFWLTSHPGGWAKGIEVFRQYVNQVNPPRPLPPHIRDGVGFQTIWMTQPGETDPAKAYFRFNDLPRVARDAKAHGIDELTPWDWCLFFSLPIHVRPILGSKEDFLDGVRRARELGVNVSPFISVHIINGSNLARYGMKATGAEDWDYNPELIPRFLPYYVKFPETEGTLIDSQNKVWEQDLWSSLMEWINSGIYSFDMDQFFWDHIPGRKPGLVALTEKLRAITTAKDPEATFAGESSDLEYDNRVLDYTWNWIDYVDAGPILNVLRSPRLNCNVQDSALVVKKGFADGLYLNVMPKKPDEATGSALISDEPALAQALDEVAPRRKQFLPYFTQGVFLGDSVLSAPTSAFVSAHQLQGKLLIIVLNDRRQAQQVVLQSDLRLWLPAASSYQVEYYDAAGKLAGVRPVSSPHWVGVTHLLQPLELAFFVVEPYPS
jgi:hypothetical protein